MQRLDLRLQRNPNLKARFEQQQENFNRLMMQRSMASNKEAETQAVTTIPVVFHIVTANPNTVTDAQIQAQLDTLNKDFFGTNGDSVRIPSYFKPLFGKSSIQFCLAQRTPDGEITNGIIRKANATNFSIDDAVKHVNTGGSDAWNTDAYLNIWVSTLSGGILGYATFPNDGSPDDQGVVIDYRSLPGGSLTQYNGGKTLTHETGHYFNLSHIWGDDNGTCTGTDFVGDTPNQGDASGGCSTGIKTDNCTTTGNGVMYQNYMDYSYDQCLVMFTIEQVKRMEAALSQSRSSLLSSNGCQPVILRNYDLQLRTINNPAQRVCATNFTPSVTVRNRGVQAITSIDFTVSIDNNVVGTYKWTSSISSLQSQTITLNSAGITVGVHTISIAIGLINGVVDEDLTNNTLTQTVQYFPPVTSVSESFESSLFPPAGWDIVNADGSITWQRVTGIAKTGSASVMINNFDYDRIGEKDDLRLPTVNLSSSLDSAFLSFQVAAATYTATSTTNNVWDTLEVLVSSDCGQTYTSLYKKWGSNLVTRNTPTTFAFVPIATDWRKDSINVSNLIGKSDLLFAIRNTTGFENNIYLDDIRLRTVTVNPNLKESGFLVTPNPTNGAIAVQFYPQPMGLKGIQLLDGIGRKVAEVSIGNNAAGTLYNFNLTGHPSGIYYVRAVFADKVVTKKISKL
ncbi:MAG: T9SS type A sorting domain-containing protein [Chitinophagaceae bacterium]|nr:MAG: T9SS type A sorting domain-containing protein [Chitinophagaceae bacterium]